MVVRVCVCDSCGIAFLPGARTCFQSARARVVVAGATCGELATDQPAACENTEQGRGPIDGRAAGAAGCMHALPIGVSDYWPPKKKLGGDGPQTLSRADPRLRGQSEHLTATWWSASSAAKAAFGWAFGACVCVFNAQSEPNDRKRTSAFPNAAASDNVSSHSRSGARSRRWQRQD
jgi:hypothetical protein